MTVVFTQLISFIDHHSFTVLYRKSLHYQFLVYCEKKNSNLIKSKACLFTYVCISHSWSRLWLPTIQKECFVINIYLPKSLVFKVGNSKFIIRLYFIECLNNYLQKRKFNIVKEFLLQWSRQSLLYYNITFLIQNVPNYFWWKHNAHFNATPTTYKIWSNYLTTNLRPILNSTRITRERI